MLSDEEKEAIDKLKRSANYFVMPIYGIKIILELIEKQSKEIEEFKEKFSDEKIRNTVIKRYREVIEKDYIRKDKIKAILEELDKEYKEAYNKGFKTDMVNRLREIKLMQSLLGKE